MHERYAAIAPLYDVLSLEWPVYRAGRVAGIPLLGLSAGDVVVDVGCGTGLNFPLLREAVGPRGHVVGVDASKDMLRTARGKLGSPPPPNVHLVQHDARQLGSLAGVLLEPPIAAERPVDAILFTYALSLVTPWRQAWTAATALARPGTRIVVVDMAEPTGRGRVLAPLARLACWLGGADIAAHPWSALARECDDVTHLSARAGHLQIWAGTWPGASTDSPSGPPVEPGVTHETDETDLTDKTDTRSPT